MKADLTFDIHYGYWFNLACERFYKRIDVLLSFVQLTGGSGAAVAAINNNSSMVVAAGMALSVCAALSLLIQPAVKAEQHVQAKVRWLALKPQIALLDDARLAQEVAAAQSAGPAGIGALSIPAFNASMCATGQEGRQRLVGLAGRIASAFS